jgi:hypothetical protein
MAGVRAILPGEERAMSVVAECLSHVRLGEPRAYRNLSLFPLLGAGPPEPDYLLLEEALARGCVRVTEVSEAGSVPELKLVNDCERPVLLLDGEELVGAKQNRILNLSVLVAAHTTTVIPVSCVEAGRWRHSSPVFSSAGRTHYASGRAQKARSVSESLRREGVRRSDQGAVWADIAGKSARMRAHSETSAAAALYETHRGRLDDYLGAFAPVDGETGALFAVNGRVVGLELFDTPATLAKVLRKLVQSYALDALDEGEHPGEAARFDAERLLEQTKEAQPERFPGVGLGEDLRLSGPGLTGGALAHAGRVVHLCAFRVPAAAAGDDSGGTRMARASRRARGRMS